MVKAYIPDSVENNKQQFVQVTKFEEAFQYPARATPIADLVIDTYIGEAIASLTDWCQYGKEIATSLLALKTAGQRSDLVMYYKTGNCALYKKSIVPTDDTYAGPASVFCLDVTIRDVNLAVWLKEKASNYGLIDTSLFINIHRPYQFLLEKQKYVIVNTGLKLKNIDVNKSNVITVTLEEI